MKSAPFLYLISGALTQMQGQVPPDAFEGENDQWRLFYSILVSLEETRCRSLYMNFIIAKFKARQALFPKAQANASNLRTFIQFRAIQFLFSTVLLHGASINSGAGAWNSVERERRPTNWIDCKIVFCGNGISIAHWLPCVAYRMKSRSYDNTFPNSQGHLLQTQFLFLQLCCPSLYLT